MRKASSLWQTMYSARPQPSWVGEPTAAVEHSPDGVRWTGSHTGLPRPVTGLAYGNGRYVAVSTVTADGNGRYVALSPSSLGSAIAISTNGEDWDAGRYQRAFDDRHVWVRSNSWPLEPKEPWRLPPTVLAGRSCIPEPART